MFVDCAFCKKLIEAYATPLEQRFVSQDVGKVKDVMAFDCPDHQSLVKAFLGELEVQKFADERLTIYKPHSDSLIAFIVPSKIYHGAVELIGRSIGQSHSSVSEQSDCPRYGRALDRSWNDLGIITEWFRLCIDDHVKCDGSRNGQSFDGRPFRVIDMEKGCVVRTNDSAQYIALSYVWGKGRSFRLLKDNLQQLSQESALFGDDITRSIPITIRHAMDLTRMLGLRYLWVGSLCIVQDGEAETKAQELNRMGAIYGNASLTIIAADGQHADYGLRGLREVSEPVERVCNQRALPTGQHEKAIIRIFPPVNDRHGELMDPMYYEKAWTHQEYFLSPRRLIFERGSVFWECCTTTLFEDVNASTWPTHPPLASYSAINLVRGGVPKPNRLLEFICKFNERQLTYEVDRLAAFAGIASVLSGSFIGSFICGLPKLYFDAALLWRPWGLLKRRKSNLDQDTAGSTPWAGAPSWSWAAWQGKLDQFSWNSGADAFKRGCLRSSTVEIIPLVTWFSASSPSGKDAEEVSPQWYTFKQQYRDWNETLPPHWKASRADLNNRQDNFPPKGFGAYQFTHDHHDRLQLWYPIPLQAEVIHRGSQAPRRFLLGEVEVSTLFVDGTMLDEPMICSDLRDETGAWAGILRPHCPDDIAISSKAETKALDLAAISMGIALNKAKEPFLEEWEMLERPREGDYYEWYNVLWISTVGDISYRLGVGRVWRFSWEQQKRQKMRLILG